MFTQSPLSVTHNANNASSITTTTKQHNTQLQTNTRHNWRTRRSGYTRHSRQSKHVRKTTGLGLPMQRTFHRLHSPREDAKHKLQQTHNRQVANHTHVDAHDMSEFKTIQYLKFRQSKHHENHLASTAKWRQWFTGCTDREKTQISHSNQNT